MWRGGTASVLAGLPWSPGGLTANVRSIYKGEVMHWQRRRGDGMEVVIVPCRRPCSRPGMTLFARLLFCVRSERLGCVRSQLSVGLTEKDRSQRARCTVELFPTRAAFPAVSFAVLAVAVG